VRAYEGEAARNGHVVEGGRVAPGHGGVALRAVRRVAVRYVVDALRVAVIAVVTRSAIGWQRRERAAYVVGMAALAGHLTVRPRERKRRARMDEIPVHVVEGSSVVTLRARLQHAALVHVHMAARAVALRDPRLVETEIQVALGTGRLGMRPREGEPRAGVVEAQRRAQLVPTLCRVTG